MVSIILLKDFQNLLTRSVFSGIIYSLRNHSVKMCLSAKLHFYTMKPKQARGIRLGFCFGSLFCACISATLARQTALAKQELTRDFRFCLQNAHVQWARKHAAAAGSSVNSGCRRFRFAPVRVVCRIASARYTRRALLALCRTPLDKTILNRFIFTNPAGGAILIGQKCNLCEKALFYKAFSVF